MTRTNLDMQVRHAVSWAGPRSGTGSLWTSERAATKKCDPSFTLRVASAIAEAPEWAWFAFGLASPAPMMVQYRHDLNDSIHLTSHTDDLLRQITAAEKGGMAISLINHLFHPLFDKPCWQVQPGYGSFLTLEFGMPRLTIREPSAPLTTSMSLARRVRTRRVVRVHGEWHLWIYCCHWRVTRFDQVIGDSSTTRRRKRAAQELDGQILTHVTVHPQNGASIFTFDLGAQLETFPYDQESEQWLLYEPTGEVFTLRADGCYSHMPGDTPQGQEQWHLLPRT